MSQIPCQNCQTNYEKDWPANWYTCNNCSFRVCVSCLNKHTGSHNSSGGMKCSKCREGQMQPGN